MKFFLTSIITIPFLILTSFSDQSPYEITKNQIHVGQTEIKNKWINHSADREKLRNKAGAFIQESLTNKIFPHWYGTHWDFNGYTATPKEGSIACGYFVSTTLQHCGFKLNRYKLAQQHSYGIVKTLSCGDSIYRFYSTTREKFIAKTKSKLDTGLYVIGLDNHVGFLLKKRDSVFFIHSTYLKPSQVIKEFADTSLALKCSQTFL